MKRFYRARSRVDAWLVLHRLSHAGIRAHVFHDQIAGIVGEVPPDSAQPEVWLDDPDDLERADRVVADLQAEAEGADRLCPDCSESNPASFELCWRCGHSL